MLTCQSNHLRRLLDCFMWGMMLGLIVLVFPVQAQQEAQNSCAVFEPVLPKPSHYLVLQDTADRCQILLLSSPKCRAQRHCIAGHLIAAHGMSLSQMMLPDKIESTSVMLASGVTGWFYPASQRCSRGCDSVLFWEQQGVVYGVGMQFDALAQIKRMVNQVIAGIGLAPETAANNLP